MTCAIRVESAEFCAGLRRLQREADRLGAPFGYHEPREEGGVIVLLAGMAIGAFAMGVVWLVVMWG